MNAFFFVVDDKLVDIASAQALNLVKNWDCDVHIFVERKNSTQKNIEVNISEKIYYHYDKLIQFLPPDLPISNSWPHIVYLRIFAPKILKKYDRLLYLDADVLSLDSNPEIWSAVIPSGLGASTDYGVLIQPIPPFEKMSRVEWLESLGIKSGKYFNSGVILIDVHKWLEFDFSSSMSDYFRRHPNVRCFDQDFLNYFFDGDWTDIGPRYNYQAPLLNTGLSKFIRPIFVHFNQGEKPWHGWYRAGETNLDPFFGKTYEALLKEVGVSSRKYKRKKILKPFYTIKANFRAFISKMGLRSKSEIRSTYRFHENQRMFLSYFKGSNHSYDYDSDVETDAHYFDGVNIRAIFQRSLGKLP